MPFFNMVNFAVFTDFVNFFAEGFLVTVNVVKLHISITVDNLMVAVYKLNGYCHESKCTCISREEGCTNLIVQHIFLCVQSEEK